MLIDLFQRNRVIRTVNDPDVLLDKLAHLKDQIQIEKLNGLFKDFIVFVDIMKQLGNAHEMNKETAENFSWERI